MKKDFVYLASASPRRSELLRQIGVPFEVRPAEIVETQAAGEAPDAFVLRLAAEKADAVWRRVPAEERRPVLAADTAVFSDAPHFAYGTVPGDGVHVVWENLLGANRGRYFLLTAQKIDADEAQRLGVVSEVHPADVVLARAHELAQNFASRPLSVLRYTRAALTMRLRRMLLDGLGHGLALEGCGTIRA